MSDFEQKVTRNVADKRLRGVLRILLQMLYAALAMAAFIGLERIGFISWEFLWILMGSAAMWAAFQAGRISTDIKF